MLKNVSDMHVVITFVPPGCKRKYSIEYKIFNVNQYINCNIVFYIQNYKCAMQCNLVSLLFIKRIKNKRFFCIYIFIKKNVCIHLICVPYLWLISWQLYHTVFERRKFAFSQFNTCRVDYASRPSLPENFSCIFCIVQHAAMQLFN